jgi:hypothetical protein
VHAGRENKAPKEKTQQMCAGVARGMERLSPCAIFFYLFNFKNHQICAEVTRGMERRSPSPARSVFAGEGKINSSKKEKKPEKYVEVETWNGDSFLSLKEIKQT